ncbi:MAG: hypothetical protein GTO60_16650 [Gammaproteobacteria bacterium]|nr:hypothetical protein [Gammaproteobacteria bacterium]
MTTWKLNITPVAERKAIVPAKAFPAMQIQSRYGVSDQQPPDIHRCESIGNLAPEDTHAIAMHDAQQWLADPDRRTQMFDALVMRVCCDFEKSHNDVWLALATLLDAMIAENTWPNTKSGETQHYTFTLTVDRK